MGYMAHFAVYLFAMTGLFALAFWTYKKFSLSVSSNNNGDFLKVENLLHLGGGKKLLVVKAGEEKFLISTDNEKTALISKLNTERQKDCREYTASKETVLPICEIEEEKNLKNVVSAMKRINDKIERMKRV